MDRLHFPHHVPGIDPGLIDIDRDNYDEVQKNHSQNNIDNRNIAHSFSPVNVKVVIAPYNQSPLQ